MSQLLEKIKSRGYWKVVIHPSEFVEKRIPEINGLFPILEKNVVGLRGWDFPHVDPRTSLTFGLDWVGQESHWDKYLELWRFYQSGQFVDYAGIPEDWQDLSGIAPPQKGWVSGKYLFWEDIVLRYSEIFEFAARLSMTKAGDEFMHLDIEIVNLDNRLLRKFPPGERNVWHQPSSLHSFPSRLDITRTELISHPNTLALQSAKELFSRFGWNPGIEALRDIQERIMERQVFSSAR